MNMVAWVAAIPLLEPGADGAAVQTAQLLVLIAVANTLVLMGAFLPRLFLVAIGILGGGVMVALLIWGIGFNRFLALVIPVYVVILVQLQQHMRGATVRSIHLALENEALLRELGREHDLLEHEARHDQLTGLLNRTAFMELVDLSLAATPVVGRCPAVAFVDLDHFKQINDVHGHLVGDRVLMQVADRLRGAVRDDDVIGRFGGDEFTVFLRTADGSTARRAGERIVSAFDLPFVIDGLDLPVGVSVGIGRLDGERNGDGLITAESLIRVADDSLYRAKSQGRHRVEVASVGSSLAE
jgi:diguanylate cyclase (GGDEF)-like protein